MIYLCIHTVRCERITLVREIYQTLFLYIIPILGKAVWPCKISIVRDLQIILYGTNILQFYGLLFSHGNLLYSYRHDIEDDTGLP